MRVEGKGLGFWGLRFRVWGLGVRFQVVGCRFWGLRFRVKASGFRVEDLELRVHS